MNTRLKTKPQISPTQIDISSFKAETQIVSPLHIAGQQSAIRLVFARPARVTPPAQPAAPNDEEQPMQIGN